MGLSLIIFVLAQCQWLNTDYYGYRLLPGILFIFLMGAMQELSVDHKVLTQSLVVLWLLNALYLLWLWVWGTYIPNNREVSLGLLIAMPLLAVLNKKNLPGKNAKIGYRLDKNLGALSYGVFLYHFPIIWLLKLQLPVSAVTDIIIAIALTISCAAIGHWGIERPLWRRFR
jgi:peptidoglycan/LPS O-acetylase OafA/YrhL